MGDSQFFPFNKGTRNEQDQFDYQVRRVLERFTRELGLESRLLCDITNLDLMRYVTLRKNAIWRTRSPIHAGCSPLEFWEAAFLLLFITACRRRALLNLPRPTDHDLLEKLQLRIPAEFSKTRKEQVIHLGSREVADVLAALPTKPGEPLLPWKRRNGRRMSLCNFNAAMKRFQRLAGIPEIVLPFVSRKPGPAEQTV